MIGDCHGIANDTGSSKVAHENLKAGGGKAIVWKSGKQHGRVVSRRRLRRFFTFI